MSLTTLTPPFATTAPGTPADGSLAEDIARRINTIAVTTQPDDVRRVTEQAFRNYAQVTDTTMEAIVSALIHGHPDNGHIRVSFHNGAVTIAAA